MAAESKDLFRPSDREAVHFLDRSSFRAGEILCGYEVTYKRSAAELRECFTENQEEITCKECSKIISLRGGK